MPGDPAAEGRRHRPRLRRAEPGLRPVRRPAAEPHPAPRARGLGQAAELRPADHRAGLDVDDVQQGPRHARLLRLPQPGRPLVREDDHGHLAGGQGAACSGTTSAAAGKKVILLGVPQTYPPRPVNGLMVTDFLTPSIESNYTYPPELKAEIAGLPDVHPYEFDVSDFRTPDKGKIRDAHRPDDRQAVRPRPPPADDEALGLLHDGRDGHRPRPPRLLAVHGPEHHRYEPGNPFEIGDRRLLRPRRPQDRRAARSRSPTTPTSSSSPTTAPSAWTAGSRSTSGSSRRATSSSRSPRPPRRGSKASRSTGRRRPPGARAATTAASSSTSRAASRRALIAPEDYEATRDRLVAELEALGDPDGKPIGTRVLKPETSTGRSGASRRPTCSSTSATSAGGRSARSARARSTPSRTTPGPTTPTTPPTAC